MKKQFKGFILGVVLTLAFTTSIAAFAESKSIEAFFNNIKIQVNGKQITNMDTEPFIYQGRTFVPVRFVSESLGATVNYNDSTNTVEVTGGNNGGGNVSTSTTSALIEKIKIYSRVMDLYKNLRDLSIENRGVSDCLYSEFETSYKIKVVDKVGFNALKIIIDSDKNKVSKYSQDVLDLDKTAKEKSIDIHSDINNMKQIIQDATDTLTNFEKAYNDEVYYFSNSYDQKAYSSFKTDNQRALDLADKTIKLLDNYYENSLKNIQSF